MQLAQAVKIKKRFDKKKINAKIISPNKKEFKCTVKEFKTESELQSFIKDNKLSDKDYSRVDLMICTTEEKEQTSSNQWNVLVI